MLLSVASRTIEDGPDPGVHVRMAHARVLPDRQLDLEPQRLVFHPGRSRLCRRHACAHFFRHGAFAISIYLGKRRGYGTERLAYKPHNTSFVVLGTVLLWFGCSGSTAVRRSRPTSAPSRPASFTNLAASSAASPGCCGTGVLSASTPLSGSALAPSPASSVSPLPPATSRARRCRDRFVTATGCNFGTKLKFLLGVDDTLDIFASHGIGGMIGCVMTGFFAQSSVAASTASPSFPWMARP